MTKWATGASDTRPWSEVAPATADTTHDAVVVVPGIMGSALRDTVTGQQLWGLEDVRWLARAWLRPDGVQPLHLTEVERAGHYGRVKATDLMLRLPSWAPFLQGFEPYGDLVDAVHEKVVCTSAVLQFAYDWRLPVAVNGKRLAEAAHLHLAVWRSSDPHRQAQRSHPDQRPAQLVFVAHSMGGLVTRAALAHAPELGDDTRAVVTLGTPFSGAAKTAVILNGDHGNPLPKLPRRRMQALSAGLPGVHDLLPAYRCVDTGADVHRITPAEVAALGGDKELAEQAQDFQRRMRAAAPMPGHRCVVGIAQPTVQSVRLEAGVVQEQYVAFETDRHGELSRDPDGRPRRRNRAGDGTVYRDAAYLVPGPAVHPMPLQHGALAKASDALRYVQAVLTEYDEHLGPAMGAGDVGLDVPDCVDAGAPWTLRLLPDPDTSLDTHAGITCTVHEATTDRMVDTIDLGWQDGDIAATVSLPAGGLYRIRVGTGGNAPLTQLILAIDPADTC